MRRLCFVGMASILLACGPSGPAASGGESETSETWAGTTGEGCCGALSSELMLCEDEGAPEVEIGTTFEWVFFPDQINEDVCTVTNVEVGAATVISFDCSSEPASLTVPATPSWDPPLAPGTSVRLRADLTSDDTPGVGPYLSWRIDRVDDQSLVAVFLGGRAFSPLDDSFAAEIVEDLCRPDCVEGIEPVAVRLSEGEDELTLTAPGVATFAGYQVWLADAEQDLCEPGEGLFNILIALSG